MEQLEIIDLAMEALILKKQEPRATEEERKVIDQKLKELGYMYVLEAQKKNK
jgi:hypothetical protein